MMFVIDIHVKIYNIGFYLYLYYYLWYLGHTDNFMELDPQVGDMGDLEDLVKAAKERDQYLILELDPNHSSMKHSWFEQSVNTKDPYTDYYIWADGKTTSDGRRQPPNNWVLYLTFL